MRARWLVAALAAVALLLVVGDVFAQQIPNFSPNSRELVARAAFFDMIDDIEMDAISRPDDGALDSLAEEVGPLAEEVGPLAQDVGPDVWPASQPGGLIEELLRETSSEPSPLDLFPSTLGEFPRDPAYAPSSPPVAANAFQEGEDPFREEEELPGSLDAAPVDAAYDGGVMASDFAAGCDLAGCDLGCGTSRCRTRSCKPIGRLRSFFKGRGIEVGGWIDQGVSVVDNNPADRYNGVVTFNDRDGEYQMNQFWLYAERAIDNGGCGWAIGGRVDFVYGTDARFTQAVDGLEANWNQTARFYQAALPQAYVDVAYNDVSVRVGHFYTIIGYEVVAAPENFFYSHSYSMQYGEPFTHTGALATIDWNRHWSFSAGVHRGWDQFDDTDGLDSMGFLGGATWTSCDRRKSVALAITSGEQGRGDTWLMYSVVGKAKIGKKLTGVLQYDYGNSSGGAAASAEWYGLSQSFLYQISRCWSAGARVEWFRDNDGSRVTGLGSGNLNTGPFVGDFFEATVGLNWKPRANIRVRPELRWDWYGADTAGGPRPFDAGDQSRQFMFGCDMIVSF